MINKDATSTTPVHNIQTSKTVGAGTINLLNTFIQLSGAVCIMRIPEVGVFRVISMVLLQGQWVKVHVLSSTNKHTEISVHWNEVQITTFLGAI